MGAKLGSLLHSFEEKWQSLLSPKYSYGSMDDDNGDTKCVNCCSLGDFVKYTWKGLHESLFKLWKFARSDPRNVIFSAKMGLALVIMTMLIFTDLPNTDIDQYAIWGIFTVILVFEFSIGATLSKGFNRGFGTLFAGGLALGVAELSLMTGRWEEVFIIISIFFAGFCATHVKLYPEMKRYEYGFRVFLVTFCYILVFGFEREEFIKIAVNRFLLILIGAAVSLTINICVYPIWAGEDLHNLVVRNFNGVANSLEGCVDGYLQCVEYEWIPSKSVINQAAAVPLYEGYMSAVESVSQEDMLEGFATWEPPHGRYKMFKYPWKNYVKLSGALRHCAFTVMTLHGCILSEIQAPPEKRNQFNSELKRVSGEAAKVLRELAEKVKKMEKLRPEIDILMEVHEAAEELQHKIDEKSYILIDSKTWLKNNGDELSRNKNPLLYSRSMTLPKSWVEKQPEPRHEISIDSSLLKSVSLLSDQNREKGSMYESASALSLATFASLLVEFVARLQNLVETFEELSEAAKFKEYNDDRSEETTADTSWSRLTSYFGFKNCDLIKPLLG